jgi:hypothetical protein
MKDPVHHDLIESIGEAYELMLERAMEGLKKVEKKTGPVIHQLVDKARDTAIELEELSAEEAEKLASYLKRDLADSGEYLAKTGGELKDWLGFEADLVKRKLYDLMLQAADKSTLALLELKEQAAEKSVYRTGEVTGAGALVCDACGEHLHFHKAGRIPPCPKCRATLFHRPH